MIRKILTRIASPVAMTLGTLFASPALAQINTDYGISTLGEATPEEIVINLINWILGILALVAVVLVLIGGFKWMTAAGNEEKIESAKKLLVAAIIGLLIILAAWGVSLYAVQLLLGVTNASQT